MKKHLLSLILFAAASVFADSIIMPPGVSQADYDALTGVYGHIYIPDGAVALTLTNQNTYYPVTGFTLGESNNCTLATDGITVDEGGVFDVSMFMSFRSGTGNSIYEVAIFVDGVEQENIEFNRKQGTAGDIGSGSAKGIVTLTAGQVVAVQIQCTSGAGTVVTVEQAQLNVSTVRSVTESVESSITAIEAQTNTWNGVTNTLPLNNTTAFAPDADYEPATKKYVDDNAGGGQYSIIGSGGTEDQGGSLMGSSTPFVPHTNNTLTIAGQGLKHSVNAGVPLHWLDAQGAWEGAVSDYTATNSTYGTSMKLSATGDTSFKFVLPEPINLQTHSISFRVLQLDANCSAVALQIGIVGTTNLWNTYIRDGIQGVEGDTDRWRRVVCVGGNYDMIPGIPALDDIRAIGIKVHTSTATDVVVSDFRIHRNALKPGVVFVFDDGLAGVHDYAFPLFQARGYAGTVAVTKNYTETVGLPDYSPLSEMLEMQRDGWEIVNHTITNSPLSNLTPAQAVDSVEDNYEWMLESGFKSLPAKYLVLPGGGENKEILDVIDPITSAILDADGTTPIPPYVYDDRLMDRLLCLSNHTVAANFDFRLDSITTNGGIHILMLHDVVVNDAAKDDQYDVTAEFLTNFLDSVEARGLEVYSLSDVLLGSDDAQEYSLRPVSGGSSDLGASSFEYGNVYAQTGHIGVVRNDNQISLNGLSFYYPFDGDDPSDVDGILDRSENLHRIRLAATANLSTSNDGDVRGDYFSHDTANNTWFYPENGSNDYTSVTFAAMVRTDALAQNEWLGRVNDAWELRLNTDRTVYWRTHVGAGNNILQTTDIVPTNEWTFIAATYDGITQRVYINGVESASDAYAGPMVTLSYNRTLVGSYGTNPLSGDMDDITLFKRALSAGEIKSLYRMYANGKKLTFSPVSVSKLTPAVKSDIYTIGTDDPYELYGGVVFDVRSIANTISIPEVLPGMNFEVIAAINAHDCIIDPDDSDQIILNGVLLDAGDKIRSGGTLNETARFFYYTAGKIYADAPTFTDDGP